MGMARREIDIVGGKRRLLGHLLEGQFCDIRRDDKHVRAQKHHRIRAVADRDGPGMQFIPYALGMLAVGSAAVAAHGYADFGRHDARRPTGMQPTG